MPSAIDPYLQGFHRLALTSRRIAYGRAICATLLAFCLMSVLPANAQNIVGFEREDFGKVVLTTRQSASGDPSSDVMGYFSEPISRYDKRSVFYRLGSPVGRLDVLTDVRMYPCTGFLISPKYVMTNHHCVKGLLELSAVRKSGAKKVELIQFVLGYTVEGIEESGRRYSVKTEPVESNRELDYAILEVSGEPAKSFGWLRLASSEPLKNSPLWIIGHPLGDVQRISREQCKSADPAVSGGRLRHTCDTLPGNSGSPVLDPDTKSVIALHHAGSKSNSINYAIPISRIVARSVTLQALLSEHTSDPQFMAAGNPLRTEPFPPGQDDPILIAGVMQKQLQRIGCYSGAIDGIWGRGSQSSITALPKLHRDRLTAPTVSFQNVRLLRELDSNVCAHARPQPERQRRNGAGAQRPTTNARVQTRGASGSSTCIQRAQRYCSNPDNSSAIGYQACLTQAKAGCRQ